MEVLVKRKFLPLLLFIVAPIGFFYFPNLPIYVLGDLREGSIQAWLLLNFLIVAALGLAVFLIYADVTFIRPATFGLILLLLGMAILNFVPTLLYWDTFAGDGILRDDLGVPGPKANILMFLWHCFIVGFSIISAILLIIPYPKQKKGNIA